MEKAWKKEPLTFEQFKDLWEQNNKLELAKAYLVVLKESVSVPLEDKIRFLSQVISDCAANLRAYLVEAGSSEIRSLAAKTFLEIMPKCDHMVYLELMDCLGELTDEQKKGWEWKIKTFAHSYLDNSVNKKVIFDNPVVVKMLIHNRMFEEMVNYDFISDLVIGRLVIYLFPQCFSPWCISEYHLWDKDDFESLSREIHKALRENREPHAVSVLLRLLAKRGDLDKIFPC